MTKRLSNLDLNQNQLLQALAQVLGSDPSSPVAGQFWYHSGTGTLRFRTGSSTVILGRLDQLQAPTADVSLNSNKITNLADGASVNDAVNKGQLDAAVAGMNWKDSVKAATTAAGTLASSFENGDTVDGVTLATGDRILIKNQAAGAENGVYTVNASGAPTRATDADTGAEILQAAVFVEQGTTNADTGWVLSTNGPITLGTTSLTFAQFTGSGTTYAADGTTLALSGSTFSLVTPVTVANGGTGSGTASGARTNLGVPGKYAATIGNGSSTSIAVTHNLGTRDVVVSVHDATTFAEYECDVEKTDTNNCTLGFATAPASSSLRVTVIG